MRPLNPANGVVERFACELRALRALAGDSAFWKMARRCEVSKSALAAAVTGESIPSERVLQAFVEVCGGDWPWWKEHRRQALEEAQLEERPVGTSLLPRPPGLLEFRSRIRRSAPARAAEDDSFAEAVHGRPHADGRTAPRGLRLRASLFAAAVLGAGLTLGIQYAGHSSGRHPASVAPLTPSAALPMIDGADPKAAGCDTSAATTLSTSRVLYGPFHLDFGQIIARYSRICRTVWAQFEGGAGLDVVGSPITIELEAIRPSSGRAVSSNGVYKDGKGVYKDDDVMSGNMLSTIPGCVVAIVVITAAPLKGDVTARTGCVSGS